MLKKVFLGLLVAGLLVGGAVTSVYAFGPNTTDCPTEPIPEEILGMTAQEVRDEIRSGKTLPQIFEENGLDYASYTEQWLADHEACLAEAVSEGELTEEQAQLLQDRLEARVADGLFGYQRQFFADSMRSYMQFRMEKIWEGGNGIIGQILDKLEITFDDLRARITGGETLEDIASEAGIDLKAVHEERIQTQLEKVEQALADGKITEAQADRIRDRLNYQLENPDQMNLFERMFTRTQRPMDRFEQGGRPGGAGMSRGNSGGNR